MSVTPIILVGTHIEWRELWDERTAATDPSRRPVYPEIGMAIAIRTALRLLMPLVSASLELGYQGQTTPVGVHYNSAEPPGLEQSPSNCPCDIYFVAILHCYCPSKVTQRGPSFRLTSVGSLSLGTC